MLSLTACFLLLRAGRGTRLHLWILFVYLLLVVAHSVPFFVRGVPGRSRRRTGCSVHGKTEDTEFFFFFQSRKWAFLLVISFLGGRSIVRFSPQFYILLPFFLVLTSACVSLSPSCYSFVVFIHTVSEFLSLVVSVMTMSLLLLVGVAGWHVSAVVAPLR